MDYELAKQLKEAGFPQTSDSEYKHIYPNETATRLGTDGMREPTLSELIEACGDDFIQLRKTHNKPRSLWLASSLETDESAETPEEAVAKLWLELIK